MTRSIIIVATLVVTVAAAVVLLQKPADEQAAALDGLSPLARGLLDGSEWEHMGAKHVLVHAQSRDVLARAARQADFSLLYVHGVLGTLKTAEKPAHLFLVADADLWEKVLLGAGVRREGLAAHHGNEVFVFHDPGATLARLKIPHEMVHLCLDRAYGRALPLWLEEGLAGHWGWAVARTEGEAAGQQLERTMPALEANDLMPIETFTALETYPSDAARLRAFYRQSQDLVRAIEDRVGADRLGPFVRVMAETGGDWRDVLKHHFNCTSGELRDTQDRAISRSMETVVD